MQLRAPMHRAMLVPMALDTALIGSTESCRILDINKSTLTRWVVDGTITPAHRLPGKNGALLFRRSDIERIRDERESRAAS